MALSAAERRAVDEQLRAAFTTFDDLNAAMTTQLGRMLHTYAAPGGMLRVVNEVIDYADAEGWVADLRGLRPVRRLDNELVDLANFDLERITAAFATLLFDTRSRRLLGTALLSGEAGFFDRACKRMARLMSVSQPRPAISLDEGLNTPERALRKLVSYRTSLRSRAELCPIRADGVTDAATLSTVWGRVLESFEGLENHMVVVFSCSPTGVIPEGLPALPAPLFTVGEVGLWARRIATALGWDDAARDRLVEHIMDQLDGLVGDDRIFTLYQVLEDEITALTEDYQAFTARFAA
jgi:hypothetical protein